MNNRCSRCGSTTAATNTFCPQCGDRLGSLCSQCGTRVSFTDRYCGECGHQLDARTHTRPDDVRSPRIEKRLSIFYPSTILGWLAYLFLMACVGMAGADMAEKPDERPIWFAAGCLASYPFLTCWRWLVMERKTASIVSHAPMNEKSDGINYWSLIAYVIALALAAISRSL